MCTCLFYICFFFLYFDQYSKRDLMVIKQSQREITLEKVKSLSLMTYIVFILKQCNKKFLQLKLTIANQ